MGLQFPFPFIDVLILPTDATTGRRIVIDGVNGVIEVYDANNDLRIDIGSAPSGILFSTGDDDETILAGINTVVTSGFPSDSLATVIQSPGFINDDSASIRLESGARDQSSFDPDILTSLGQGPEESGSDLISLGRGVVAHQELTGNNGPHSADALTDMSLINVSVHEGRLYEIRLHSQYGLTAAGQWRFECRVNGTQIGQFGWASATAAAQDSVDGTVYWTPTATGFSDDITVFANEVTGAASLTLEAASDAPRTLTLKDVGRP